MSVLKPAVIVLLLASTAHADDLQDKAQSLVESLIEDGTGGDAKPMQFQFTADKTVTEPQPYAEPEGATGRVQVRKPVLARSADGTAAWFAADADQYGYCGADECFDDPPVATYHVTMLLDDDQPIVWHEGKVITAKQQAKALAKGVTLSSLARTIDDGAEDVAALFESSFADPKLLAKAISTRKDVVLFGSDRNERYVGAKVRSQLAKWKLAFTVRDGIRAGLTHSQTVAWVAAKVDARPVKKPNAKPSPYRVLAIYEKGDAGWALVQVSFSFVASED